MILDLFRIFSTIMPLEEDKNLSFIPGRNKMYKKWYALVFMVCVVTRQLTAIVPLPLLGAICVIGARRALYLNHPAHTELIEQERLLNQHLNQIKEIPGMNPLDSSSSMLPDAIKQSQVINYAAGTQKLIDVGPTVDKIKDFDEQYTHKKRHAMFVFLLAGVMSINLAKDLSSKQ